MEEPTKKVRDAIVNAREPVEFIYTQLPEAVGRPTVQERDPEYARRLAIAMGDMRSAYDDLLARAERDLVKFFELRQDGYRQELAGFAKRIQDKQLADGNERLAHFLQRVVDPITSEGDRPDRPWLEAVCQFVVDRRPEDWVHRDEKEFRHRLEELALTYHLVLAMLTRRTEKSKTASELVSVSVLRSSTGDARHHVFDVTNPNRIQKVRDAIQAAVGRNGTAESAVDILTALASELEDRLAGTPNSNEERRES